jgi:hypothetical protein
LSTCFLLVDRGYLDAVLGYFLHNWFKNIYLNSQQYFYDAAFSTICYLYYLETTSWKQLFLQCWVFQIDFIAHLQYFQKFPFWQDKFQKALWQCHKLADTTYGIGSTLLNCSSPCLQSSSEKWTAIGLLFFL